MMALMADIRVAIRALIAARGFSALAGLTLSAGIALTCAVTAVINAYVFRSLPYPHADRLYRIDYAPEGHAWPRGMEQLDWHSLSDVIEIPLSWDLDVFYMLGREYPETAPGAWVTPGYMEALGVRVALGRTFTPDDFRQGTPPVAIISHRLWQTRFGGDIDVTGKTFDAYVSDRPQEPEFFTVVGVAAPDLWHLNAYTDVLSPLRAPSYPYQVRLREGVTAAAAAARLDALVRRGATDLPPQFGVVLASVHGNYVAQVKPVLWAILAGTGLVLLITTANVAVLMILRARKRERELAVRLALGATPARIARLVAIEGFALGSTATVAGVLLASVVLPVVAPMVERSLGRRVPRGLDALSLDAAVLAIVIACGAAVTLVLAMIPVVMLWRSQPELSVAGSARGISDGTHASRSRATLIAFEVAASLTLIVGAGLMAESAWRMLRVNFGIDADRVVSASLALRQQSFSDDADRAALFERLGAELRRVAGGSTVAFGDWWPLQGSRPRKVEGSDASAGAMANPFAVSTDYFAALGIRPLDGRTFSAGDRLGSDPVVIVSESLALSATYASRTRTRT